jgi:phosphoribosylformylglycinamidine synthase
MPKPRVFVLRAPGTNCDGETAFAFERAGALVERIHVNRWLESPRLADDYQILCVPGGFSYGDDIAAGRILATKIRQRLSDAIVRFIAAGKLVLGVCNGFQVLLQTGALLADLPDGARAATLTLNDSGRFEDRWIHLKPTAAHCVFLQGVESLYLPIAHAEGKFVAATKRHCALWKRPATSRCATPPPTAATTPRSATPTTPTARWATWRACATRRGESLA